MVLSQSYTYSECNSAESSSNVLCYKKCFAENDFLFFPDLKHKATWFLAQGYMVSYTELYGFKCRTLLKNFRTLVLFLELTLELSSVEQLEKLQSSCQHT